MPQPGLVRAVPRTRGPAHVPRSFPPGLRTRRLSRTLQNNLATGTLGASVTAANSGGQSGASYNDQFTFYAPSQRPVYDNAHTHGASTLAMRVDEANGSVLSNYVGWDSLTFPPGQQAFCRLYFYLTANPSQNVQLIRYVDKTNINTFIGGVRLTNTGTLVALKANNTVLGSATTAMPLNQWIRLECRVLPNSGNLGEVEFRVWTTNPESLGAADFTQNNTAVSSLGGDQVGAIAYGICNAPTAFTAAWSIWIDDVSGAAFDWIGPSQIFLPVLRSTEDLVFSAPYPGALTYPSQTLFPGSSMSDAIGAVKTTGGATFNRAASDSGVTVTDTVATLRARVLSDTGVTVTDAVATLRLHQKADTGTTVSDSVATNRTRVLADTGTTTSDSVVGGRGFARAIADTGATNTDTVATLRVHLVADTGAANTDSVATLRVRVLADTATTMSDSVVGGRGFARAIADTGLTNTDAVATLRVHLVADTGVAVSDQLARRIGRVITDTGLTLSDTPALRLVHLIGVSDTGLTLSDSVVAVSGQPRALSGLYGVVGKVDSSGLVNVGSATGIVQL